MDTAFTVSFGPNEAEALCASAAVACFARIDEIERLLTKFSDTSDVAVVRGIPSGGVAVVSHEMMDVLVASVKVCAATGGAFDPTVEARSFGELILDVENFRVGVKNAPVELDFGGIAKGYALDECAKILRSEQYELSDWLLDGGTSTLAMKKSVEAIAKRYRLGTVVCYGDFDKSAAERISGLNDEVRVYNKAARKLKKPVIAEDVYIRREGSTVYYNSSAFDEAADPEVLKEMKVNGAQKSRFTKFKKDVRDQVAKGIPLFWGVRLGIYPEPGIPQTAGGHMRLIIGYNDKKNEILYTDSWGAGHELKRMPVEWAWTISRCLMFLKPLNR